jgi:hypothetical protein
VNIAYPNRLKAADPRPEGVRTSASTQLIDDCDRSPIRGRLRPLWPGYGATQLVNPDWAESSAVPFTPNVPDVLVF